MPILDCGFSDTASEAARDILVRIGPTLNVDIGFDPTYHYGPANPAVPNSGLQNISALLDTGATESCIDDARAQHLNLPLVDRRKIAGNAGAHEVPVYLAHIHVPQIDFVQHGTFSGVKLLVGGQGHGALIGRTFLRGFVMFYDGRKGSVTIAR